MQWKGLESLEPQNPGGTQTKQPTSFACSTSCDKLIGNDLSPPATSTCPCYTVKVEKTNGPSSVLKITEYIS